MDRIKFDGMGSECAHCGIDAGKDYTRCPVCGKLFTDKPWLVYKHPSEKIVIGSKLVVGESQKAIFVNLGEITDVFGPGTYDMTTRNLPILNKLVNIPWGGRTPFPAEIYFVNMTSKYDLKWGTLTPFQTTDPKFDIIIRVRAYGQFGLKVNDPSALLRNIIGTLRKKQFVDYQKFVSYLRSIIVSTVKGIIASNILKGCSVLDITSALPTISELCRKYSEMQFKEFGLDLTNLIVESINIPDEDLEGVKNILNRKAEFEVLGDKRYITMRSFDVLEKGALNSGGAPSALTTGLGLGIGLNSGKGLISLLGTGELEEVEQLGSGQPDLSLESGKASLSLNAGDSEYCGYCGESVKKNSAFCSHCGKNISHIVCGDCGCEMSIDSKFCPNCGHHLTFKICEVCSASNQSDYSYCHSCGNKFEPEIESE